MLIDAIEINDNITSIKNRRGLEMNSKMADK